MPENWPPKGRNCESRAKIDPPQSMARTERVVALGAPHHIAPRGNHRQDVFLSAEDRPFLFAAPPTQLPRTYPQAMHPAIQRYSSG